MVLSKRGEIRTMYHLHYTTWPDFGVPSTTDGIRELVNFVNMYREMSTSNGPIVVHCSAGVGRSGTFIAIHSSFAMVDNDQDPCITEIATQMRRERIGMIQNEKQFEFIYLSLQDYKSLVSSSAQHSLLSSHSSSSLTSDDSDLDFDSDNTSFPPSPNSTDWRKMSSIGVNLLRFSNISPLNVLS